MSDNFYLGNPLLKRTNVPMNISSEQALEFAKCMDDPIYFAKKYVKIVTLDHGLQPYQPYHFQEKMIRTFHENRFSICKLPRQSGKALALDTPIPTPDGWTTMGDLKVGDDIISPSGDRVSVIMKTETMYNHDCYKICFDNGEEITADADHLWEVNSSYWDTGKKILTTKEISNAYSKKNPNKRGLGVEGAYYINITNPIKTFYDSSLPIDPYLLGVWLGDGYSQDSRIIAHKDDFEIYKNKIEVEYIREDKNCIRFKCLNLQSKLKNCNLLKNKHIPQVYLRSSYQSRLELLRGLMDTDGSVKPNSRAFEFYQKNYDLVIQVVDLLSSMGIKSRVRSKKIKNCLYYTVSFTTEEIVFNLPRKCELINTTKPTRPQDKRIYIRSIKKVDSVPVACISVDSEDKLFLCGKTFIPTHNSTTVVAFLLHYMIFYDNVNIAILANKAKGAMEALGRFQTAYENIPIWLQQGVKSWNKGSLELENGSRILAASTSASSVRGGSYNIIYLDEFAFVPQQIADSFFASVLPTISSGESTKVIITSTPLGMNHFYKMWQQALSGESGYIPLDIHWTDVPGRDEEFKRKMIAAFGGDNKKWQQEFETDFLGSANTLISGSKLTTLVSQTPIKSNKGLDVYEEPVEEHLYMITVDVSRGTGLDYHAFTVFDITQYPHKVVAKYHNNEMDPILYPYVIKDTGMAYNKAYVLCETNDLGAQVANSLHHDLEYPNLLICYQNGRSGQILGQNFSSNKAEMGVKMSPKVKHIGCINLKTLIETEKLIVTDADIISELTTFIQKGKSFEADSGKHDDLVMTLVSFAWAVNQPYFKDITDLDIRKKLYEEKEKEMTEDLLPFGFVSDGNSGNIDTFRDQDGEVWFTDNPVQEQVYDWGYMF